MTKFRGTDFVIAGDTIAVPALSLGQLRNGLLEKLQKHDELLSNGKIFEAMSVRGEVIFAAIQRNYPEFAEEKLFNYLDLSNTTQIWLTVLGQSGFNSGETLAAETTSPVGTSSPSTGA